MSNSNVLAECRRNDSEVLRVGVTEYQGRRFIDIRIWYRSREGAEYKPGKGCAIRPEHVDEVARALGEAKALMMGDPDA